MRHVLREAIVIVLTAGCLAQSPSERPAFEVASVKPAPGGCAPSESPGRISQCSSLTAFIQIAYNLAAFGPSKRPGRRLEILGGPAWLSDTYQINAKANFGARSDQMHGPMLQVLLEERFHLKIRRETRERPVYSLTIARSGLKVEKAKEGSCTPPDYNHPLASDCGKWTASTKPNNFGGKNIVMNSRGETMADFAGDLSNMGTDRVILDRTGVEGLFNLHLEYTQEAQPGNHASAAEPAGPSIFTALQEQLGLKLTSGKGPVEVLFIDHIERPSAN